MPKYYVGIKILNTFEVEADNEEQAEEIVRDLSIDDTLWEADYEISYVEETD
jgi:hypothetical protein